MPSRLLALPVLLLALALSAPSASAAKLRAPSNANVGERIMAIVKVKKPSKRYTLTLTSLSTSGRVCGRDLGRPKRAGRGDFVRYEVTIPKRLPCFKGPRGNGRRVGSVRVTLGNGPYGMWFGQREKRFFWTNRKTFAQAEIELS
jgi:hypothetical protein